MAAWPFIASAGLPDAGNVAWILACPANAQNADLRIYRLQLRFDRDPQRPDLGLVGELHLRQEAGAVADRIDHLLACQSPSRRAADRRCIALEHPALLVSRPAGKVREVNNL